MSVSIQHTTNDSFLDESQDIATFMSEETSSCWVYLEMHNLISVSIYVFFSLICRMATFEVALVSMVFHRKFLFDFLGHRCHL